MLETLEAVGRLRGRLLWTVTSTHFPYAWTQSPSDQLASMDLILVPCSEFLPFLYSLSRIEFAVVGSW